MAAHSVEEIRRRFQGIINASREETDVRKRLNFSATPPSHAIQPILIDPSTKDNLSDNCVSTPSYDVPYSRDVSWDTHWDTVSIASSHEVRDPTLSILPPPPGFQPLQATSMPMNMELMNYINEASLLGVTPGLELQRYVTEQRARKDKIELAKIEAYKTPARVTSQGLVAPKLQMKEWNSKDEDLEAFLHRFERIMREYEFTESQTLNHFSALLKGEPLKIFHRMDASSDLTYTALKRELLHCYGYSVREYQKIFDETILSDEETSQQYLGRLTENFRRLFSKAYPKQHMTIDSLLNHILRQQFLKGIDRGCRFKLAEQGINDIDEMADFVDKWRNARKEMQENNRTEEKTKKMENRKSHFGARLSAATEKVETATGHEEKRTAEKKHEPATRKANQNRTVKKFPRKKMQKD